MGKEPACERERHQSSESTQDAMCKRRKITHTYSRAEKNTQACIVHFFFSLSYTHTSANWRRPPRLELETHSMPMTPEAKESTSMKAAHAHDTRHINITRQQA